ncbi:MAG: hybrid sensor histidine kinase/response regulator [Cyanobacteria bacterium J055]|nr:MAG: hybrid sensor histidine kinase/response regulator [Cyanobacteria bacterium J055]
MNLDRSVRVKASVLVVDDKPDNLRLLSTILTDQGYEVRQALSGRMALTAARIRPPDLVLLDVKMPDLNGYQVCEQLKADEQTRHIPVIFLSALDRSPDKIKGFSSGGADYITKPFQESEVVVRVEHHLEIARLQARLERQNAQRQQEIRDRIAMERELLRSNKDLEQFAHAVSHDLQQPLQSILGFSKILSLQYSQLSEAEVGKYLWRIVQAGERMQQLIEDLLAYSQVDVSRSLEVVNCDRVVAEALDNLQAAISQTGARIAISPLPTIKGKSAQLIQVFQNLIGNALKFTRPDVPPDIDISVELGEGEWVFRVRDNGIGIDPQHYDRLFQLFQRLHLSDRYPGTGIGLATCKKIVESHGGRIWVESKPGWGTTFFFSLPKL